MKPTFPMRIKAQTICMNNSIQFNSIWKFDFKLFIDSQYAVHLYNQETQHVIKNQGYRILSAFREDW